MSGSSDGALRLFGNLLRVAAVCILAFAGLCTCGLGLMGAESPHSRTFEYWSVPIESGAMGIVLWVAGSWLVRRFAGRQAKTDG